MFLLACCLVDNDQVDCRSSVRGKLRLRCGRSDFGGTAGNTVIVKLKWLRSFTAKLDSTSSFGKMKIVFEDGCVVDKDVDLFVEDRNE